MVLAIIANAISMAERNRVPKVPFLWLPKDPGPESRSVFAPNRLPVFVRFHKFEAYGAHIGPQVHGFYVEKIQLLILWSDLFGEPFSKFGGLFSDFQPIEKRVGGIRAR